MKADSRRALLFLHLYFLICLLLAYDANAQKKAALISKEELTPWLNQKRDCPPESPLHFYRLDYFDFKGDGKQEAIVVASSCMTGTSGPDIHSVIDWAPSRELMELEIPDAAPETYDSLFGNRNYDLTEQDGFLVATFADDPDRPNPLVIKYKWSGKKFSIASIKKTGIFPTGYDCLKSETEVERAICYVKELADLDLQLNAAYKSSLAELPPDKKDALRAQERAWLINRDRQCAPYKGWVGCLRISYQERIKELTERSVSPTASTPQKPQYSQ